jgi:chromosome partitioning related protein ParA
MQPQTTTVKPFRKTIVAAVVSTKGGVGKTTLAANLAGLLAQLEQRVLLVDADMQPSLSHYFRLDKLSETGIAEVISRGGLIRASDISKTNIKNLDLLRSNLSDATQAWLKDREDRLVIVRRAIQQPVVQDNYDIVVIDTQGAKGELQRSAAMAADFLISPFVPDMINFSEFFPGTLGMLAELNSMSDFAPTLRAGPLKVVINAMDRTNNSKNVLEALMGKLSVTDAEKVSVLETMIARADAYRSARSLHLPVHEFDARRSDNSPYNCMHSLVHELFPHLQGEWADATPSLAAGHAELTASNADKAGEA